MAEEEAAVEGVEEALVVLAELAKTMDSGKSVSLMIKNTSDAALVDLSAFQTSGKIFGIPRNRIDPDRNGTLGFYKTPFGLCGAEGVVVYKMADRDLYLCIFYTVPFIGLNGFWIQWVDNFTMATKDLSTAMARNQWEITNQITWHDVDTTGYRATGFMTQGDDAKMIVQVSNLN
ncbi:Hypothetical predicted protein [Mytilus galloprovincialis]|uniref:Uncharacterized protein n=1 Tax=Mytilus galloprovincialis TaxID=29158 RepID=A0A8B6DHG7_MYTGA|nr:Hypothetical predicted protein [Mytilus galloprovincialis]